jgi:hypothetical protein
MYVKVRIDNPREKRSVLEHGEHENIEPWHRPGPKLNNRGPVQGVF